MNATNKKLKQRFTQETPIFGKMLEGPFKFVFQKICDIFLSLSRYISYPKRSFWPNFEGAERGHVKILVPKCFFHAWRSQNAFFMPWTWTSSSKVHFSGWKMSFGTSYLKSFMSVRVHIFKLNFWIPNDQIQNAFGGNKKDNVYPMRAQYDWLRIYELDEKPFSDW